MRKYQTKLILDENSLETLIEIGRQLDANDFPVVFDGGIVMPSGPPVVTVTLGEDIDYVRSGKRGSEAGSRKRAARRKGSASKASSIISSDIEEKYSEKIEVLIDAYPGTKVWSQGSGVWLLTYSHLFYGSDKGCYFLTGIPFDPRLTAKSWGFWGTKALIGQWIGPKHTNYPDGSVCAFEPKDGTWAIGNSIVDLIDIYSSWAIRQLYFNTFGKWPGTQVIHHPFERLIENRKDEFCGCGSNCKIYSECCRPEDLAKDLAFEYRDFYQRTNGGKRRPPSKILDIVYKQSEPPNLSQL